MVPGKGTVTSTDILLAVGPGRDFDRILLVGPAARDAEELWGDTDPAVVGGRQIQAGELLRECESRGTHMGAKAISVGALRTVGLQQQ